MRSARARRMLILCAVATASFGHDVKLDSAQREALARVAVLLRPGITLERLKDASKALEDFDDDALRHLLHAREVARLEESETVLHAVRSIDFARTHGRHLPDPWPVALLLGSPRPMDWHKGVRLLRRRPFDAGLEQVVVALADDPRPELRLAAGRLAKTLFVFGRRSENLERVARRLLVDKSPNVAALFAVYDAHTFESKELFDLLVARLGDDRELEFAMGILNGGGTVRSHVLSCLRNEFFWWRSDLPFTTQPGAREVSTWWRAHRDGYESGPSVRGSRRVVDWTGKCRLGQRTKVPSADGPLWIEVRSYEEGWFEGKPVYSAVVMLWTRGSEGEWIEMGGGGPKNAEEAEHIRGQFWGDSGPESWREFQLAPLSEQEVRVRAKIWVGGKQR